MDTNEFDFYYFIGGEDVDVTPPPQQETFFSLTEALDFAQGWAENRRKFEQSTLWRIDYCRDTSGVVMIAHSNPERCRVNDWARGIICAAEGFIGDWYTRLNMMAARRGLLNELINAFGVREATS